GPRMREGCVAERAREAAAAVLRRDGDRAEEGHLAQGLDARHALDAAGIARHQESHRVVAEVIVGQGARRQQPPDRRQVIHARGGDRAQPQQAALALGLRSSPYTGAPPSVWNDSQATPCGSTVQYLSLLA